MLDENARLRNDPYAGRSVGGLSGRTHRTRSIEDVQQQNVYGLIALSFLLERGVFVQILAEATVGSADDDCSTERTNGACS